MISCGWIYFLDFRFLKDRRTLALLFILVAFAVDLMLSFTEMEGVEGLVPHVGYAITGIVSFFIVYYWDL